MKFEILNAPKKENIKKISIFSASEKPRILFFPLINVKMPTIVGILTFINMKNFMLSRVEHEKSFITSGQEHRKHSFQPKATQVLFCSNITPFFIRLCEFVLSMDLDK